MAPKYLMYLKPYFRQVEDTEKADVAKEEYEDVVDEFTVEPGWILLTCSGRIGRVVLAIETLNGYFFTHDLIRVVPEEETMEGYLYAYLNSWIGQALLKQNEHGVTVEHIEPHQIEDLPVLMLPEEERQDIHNHIVTAFDHREKFMQMEKEVWNELEGWKDEIEQ